jgi:hypothetical protein
MHITDNQDALLDYLYEEGDPAERLKIAKHLQECATCSVAVLELQNVRSMLGEWTPPVSELGFRIVQDGAESHRATSEPEATRRWAWRPALPVHAAGWLQAAAAILLFVAGMAASQLRVDYADGALTLRTRTADPTSIRAVSITLPADSTILENPVAPAPAAVVPAPLVAGDQTERLLQRVRSMIDQSEQRQQRELALRLSQVAREVDTQHQADLVRIQQSLGQQQELSQRELMDMLVKTSGIAK